MHLLQRDDVGVELRDHAGNSRGVVPSVRSDAAVDVIGSDPHGRNSQGTRGLSVILPSLALSIHLPDGSRPYFRCEP